MENSRKRKQRTLDQKYEIIEFYEKTKTEIGSKTKTVKEFGLKHISVLDRILEKKDEIYDAAKENLIAKKRCRLVIGQHPEIDKQLYNHVVFMRQKHIEIGLADLQIKAQDISQKLNLKDFKASRGYIRNFISRFNIHHKSLPGEAGSVDPNLTNETGLYYKRGRSASYVTGNEYDDPDIRGLKKSKERVTLLVGACMNGDKLPLLAIGKSKNPRCFRGIKNMPMQYTNQSCAWMDANIFTNYLAKLDRKMRLESKHVIVFIDNCRAHPPLASLPNFTNIQVKFFPPNTTSRCQPLDQGIIYSLKTNYKNMVCRKKIICAENDSPFNITMLDCLNMLSAAWDNVKSETIVNCFKKANFQQSINENLNDDSDEDAVNFHLELYDDDMLPVCEDPDAPIIESTIDCTDDNSNDENVLDENNENVNLKLPTNKEALEAFNVLKQFIQSKAPDSNSALFDIECKLFDGIENTKKQTLLTDFFDKQ